jgi:hypothetical protein
MNDGFGMTHWLKVGIKRDFSNRELEGASAEDSSFI